MLSRSASTAPVLVLVDPRAQQRARIRQRALSIAAGMVVAGVSALPLVLSLGR